MNAETGQMNHVLMDRWLVHPESLYQRLQSLARTGIAAQRFAQGAVECLPSLQDLGGRVRELLDQHQPTLRIVLPEVDADAIRALREGQPPFTPEQADALHLYAFNERAADVLATLAVPEARILHALAQQPPPTLGVLGREPDADFQQRFLQNCLDWQEMVRVIDEETDTGEAGPAFDWRQPVELRADMATSLSGVAQGFARTEESRSFQISSGSAYSVVQVFAQTEEPRFPPDENWLYLRWAVQIDDVDGDAIEVVLRLPRKAAEGDTMAVTLGVSDLLAPLPAALRLVLAGDLEVARFDAVHWELDEADATRAVARLDVPLARELRDQLTHLVRYSMRLQAGLTV